MRNIYVLGAGHMGSAILIGLAKQFGFSNIRPVDIDAKRIDYLVSKGFMASSRIESVDSDDIIVLAIHPQQFLKAVHDNQVLLSHRGPVISVMAGLTTHTLCETLGHTCIVRSIPNTPSEVEEGITLYYAPKNAALDVIEAAETIFGAIGVFVRVTSEQQLDSGTALVGGGPALVAYLANVLQIYAVSEGFDSKSAWGISAQLIYGTSVLMKSTCKSPMQLCREVQTIGGTTERLIQSLDQNGFDSIVLKALAVAAKRSVELGK